MRNITVSVDDEIYRTARIKAAEAHTSVSALVKRFLQSLTEVDSDFDRRKQLQRETIHGIRSFSAGDRLRRDEVHGRHGVS